MTHHVEPSGRETTVTVDVTPDFPNFGMVPDQNIAAGFESLDEVDLVSIFNRRANVMRAIPSVLKGPYVSAVRIASERLWKHELVATS